MNMIHRAHFYLDIPAAVCWADEIHFGRIINETIIILDWRSCSVISASSQFIPDFIITKHWCEYVNMEFYKLAERHVWGKMSKKYLNYNVLKIGHFVTNVAWKNHFTICQKMNQTEKEWDRERDEKKRHNKFRFWTRMFGQFILSFVSCSLCKNGARVHCFMLFR